MNANTTLHSRELGLTEVNVRLLSPLGNSRSVARPTSSSSRSMPCNRLSLRLAKLPHAVLADLAARLCSESPALQAAAEECMATHEPLPHEMVERVLLSSDLAPHILGPLEAEDGAAAAVCSQWLAGWKASNEPRRRLKQVPLDVPAELIHGKTLTLRGTADGQLVVRKRNREHFVDNSMRILQTVVCETLVGEHEGISYCASTYSGLFADSDDSISRYESENSDALRRSTHDGTVLAEYQIESGFCFACPVLAPGSLLFCAIFKRHDGGQDEVIALDAQTLQLRHRVGQGLLDAVGDLVVVGNELYVCDTGKDCLQVFSFTGEHRRSITGEWRGPLLLCFAKDRLYLVEKEQTVGLPLPDRTSTRGRRLLVLSMQGDILQVFTHPTEPTARFQSILCFDGKLLVSYMYDVIPYTNLEYGSPGHGRQGCGMLALREL